MRTQIACLEAVSGFHGAALMQELPQTTPGPALMRARQLHQMTEQPGFTPSTLYMSLARSQQLQPVCYAALLGHAACLELLLLLH